MRKKFITAILFAFSIAALAAQGSGTPSTLRVLTDANGYLLTASAAQTLPVTSSTFDTTRLKTDASGSLLTVLAGPILAPNGTFGAPSIAFASDPTTGFYSGGAGTFRFSSVGTAIMQFGSGLIFLTDNTYPIGTSDVANRPSNIFAGTSVVAPLFRGSGTGTTVANVGANSCGTSTATIAGNQVSGVITVGTVAGTQCRVAFSTAAPVARDCMVTDSTTTIATRATYVDTTHTDFLGAFVAGDLVTYLCTVR